MMMSLYPYFLAVHIAAGSVCLLAGALSAWARKRKGLHTVVGEVYHGSYVLVFLTAVVMAVLKWQELAYLFYIALFSYGLALYGYLAGKWRRSGWLNHHIRGMLGSYIGVITAVLVVNGGPLSSALGIPSLSLWFLPTIIGSPIIALTARRFASPRKQV